MDPLHIMICIDGSKASERAAKEVVLFQFPLESRVILLHVMEKKTGIQALEKIFTPIEAILSPNFPFLERKIAQGNPSDQILAESKTKPYDLIAIGVTGTGQGLIHRRLGLTARKVIQQVETPILLVRQYSEELRKVLVCTSGETYSADTLHEGGRLASFSKAQVSVLHVMSQLALATSAQSEDLRDSAQTAMQKKTWEGLHLTWAVDQIRLAGGTSPITPILRHGLVLDQVIAELREGKYDLLVIGSHHISGRSRMLEVLLEDVTRDLVSEAACSVLVI